MAVKGTQVSVVPIVSQQQQTRKRQYRPLSTKSWILVLYMVAVLACFMIFQLLQAYGTEFADSRNIKRHISNEMRWQRRQAVSTTSTSISSDLDQTPSVTGAPNPANQLTLTSSSTSSAPSQTPSPPGGPNPANQLTLTSTTTSETITVGQPAPNEQLTLTSSPTTGTTITVPQPAPNDQLTLTSPTQDTASESTSKNQSKTTQTAVASAIPGSQLTLTSQAPTLSPTGTSSRTSPITAGAPNTASGLSLTSQSQALRTTTSSFYVTGSDGRSSLTVLTITTSNRPSLAPAPSSQMTLTSKQLQTTYLTDSAGRITATSTYALVQTSPAPVGGPAAASQLAIGSTVTEAEYFLALYLPKIIAVLFQSLWSVTYAATKLMEPFYQLASIEGASAKHSLLTEYLASGVTLDSITSIFEGRYVLGLSSTIYLLLSVLVALVSESMTIEPTAYCKTEISDRQPCNPVWLIDLRITRAVQALLIILFLAMVAMVWLNQRRHSGIESDPSRLAALTKLLGDRTFTDELRNIHPLASQSEVQGALRGNVYRLGFYSTPFGQTKYGITKTSSQVSSGEDFIQSEIGYMAVQNPETPAQSKLHGRGRTGKIIHDILLLAVVAALFSVILAYWLIMDLDNPLNKFMNSQKFGPRFLLSGAAVIIGFGIKRVEHEVRVMETYRHMSRTPQPADRSILTSLSQTTFTNLYIGMRRGQWFAVFTAFVTGCGEILVIVVSGIPQSSSQIPEAYRVCTFASLAVLGLMIITIISVLIRRASNPDIPRTPDTLANTLLYLCGSNLVQQNLETDRDEGSDDEQLVREYSGRRFDFGWASGVDGRTRWTVNEAPYDRY